MLLSESALIKFSTRIFWWRLLSFYLLFFVNLLLIGVLHIIYEIPLIVIILLLFKYFLAHLVTLSWLSRFSYPFFTFVCFLVLLEHRAVVIFEVGNVVFIVAPLFHLDYFRNCWLWKSRALFMRIKSRIRIRTTKVHHKVLSGLMFIPLVSKIIFNISRSIFEVTKMCILTSSYWWQE